MRENYKHSEETKNKIKLAHTGVRLSKKHCEALSRAHKGREVWNTGLTKETDIRVEAYSKKKRKENHWNWNGGRAKATGGRVLTLSPSHPFCNQDGYVFEHRLVMERHLGRHLLPVETVHHIDSDPSNNKIENLMLFLSRGEHTSWHWKERRKKKKK